MFRVIGDEKAFRAPCLNRWNIEAFLRYTPLTEGWRSCDSGSEVYVDGWRRINGDIFPRLNIPKSDAGKTAADLLSSSASRCLGRGSCESVTIDNGDRISPEFTGFAALAALSIDLESGALVRRCSAPASIVAITVAAVVSVDAAVLLFPRRMGRPSGGATGERSVSASLLAIIVVVVVAVVATVAVVSTDSVRCNERVDAVTDARRSIGDNIITSGGVKKSVRGVTCTFNVPA